MVSTKLVQLLQSSRWRPYLLGGLASLPVTVAMLLALEILRCFGYRVVLPLSVFRRPRYVLENAHWQVDFSGAFVRNNCSVPDHVRAMIQQPGTMRAAIAFF